MITDTVVNVSETNTVVMAESHSDNAFVKVTLTDKSTPLMLNGYVAINFPRKVAEKFAEDLCWLLNKMDDEDAEKRLADMETIISRIAAGAGVSA